MPKGELICMVYVLKIQPFKPKTDTDLTFDLSKHLTGYPFNFC